MTMVATVMFDVSFDTYEWTKLNDPMYMDINRLIAMPPLWNMEKFY